MDLNGLFETAGDFKPSKFLHNSLCLSVPLVKFIYEFMIKHMDKMTSSKVSIEKLVKDIDYLNKHEHFFEEKPELTRDR